jgi:hypothetical protein
MPRTTLLMTSTACFSRPPSAPMVPSRKAFASKLPHDEGLGGLALDEEFVEPSAVWMHPMDCNGPR